MTKIKLAIATDNGTNLIKRHFGDAEYYHIYEINGNSFTLLKKIQNSVDEKEEVHADPQKAKGIAQLLKKEGVEVLASKVFGPNIKRIIKNFACVMIKTDDLATALKLISQNKKIIKNELDKGENRSPLKLSI